MLSSDSTKLYAAFKAKDARFDGRFFVGIASTGIYCRPVCKAKKAKAENCTFFVTAAAAEQAGYRPCLLCRPELAPSMSMAGPTASLAHRAARALEENCAKGHSVGSLARRLGCTDRHLRRVFTAEFSVTPVQYLQTCRLLFAKNLLTDTSLSVLEVAMAAGFGSLRRFNDIFKKHYALSPTALRKSTSSQIQHSHDSTLTLSYHPPYQWEQIVHFLAQRAITGVEVVQAGEYLRTVHLVGADQQNIYGWVRVGHAPAKHCLTVTMSETLLPVIAQVLARVRHLFDLHCDPYIIHEALASMNSIRPELCMLGSRLPGSFNPFEMAVRAVLGQQITVKAASTLCARFVERYGNPVQTGMEGLSHIFPAPDVIAALPEPIEQHLGPLGIIGTRARTIAALARALVQGEIDFGLSAQPEVEMQKLLAIAGIGSWTAQYIAMRAMAWPDAFLETDVGIKKALGGRSPKEVRAMAEAWRPWRSYATINLWNAL